MKRFHVDAADVLADRILLREDEAHHARRVLRLPIGARVLCFDGRGRSWEGRIAAYEARGAVVDALVRLPDEPERLPRIVLAPALLKGDKMDFVVQKATELGAEEIGPVIAERSEARVDASKRLDRWRRVVLESAKQCERNRVPTILAPCALSEALRRLDGPAFAFVERDGCPLWEALAALRPLSRLTLFVGPEGGWSNPERDSFLTAGVACVSLGHRILRAETAAIAALAIVDYATSAPTIPTPRE